MDRDIAIRVIAQLEAMFQRGNEALHLVNNFGSIDERKQFQQVLGTTIAEIDIELFEPIYKQFPDLRPEGMDEINSKGTGSH